MARASGILKRIRKRIGSDLLPERIVEGYNHASEEYFRVIEATKLEENTVELVACAVDEGFRRKGIGKKLLLAMIEIYKGKTIILDVLSENKPAIDDLQ